MIYIPADTRHNSKRPYMYRYYTVAAMIHVANRALLLGFT